MGRKNGVSGERIFWLILVGISALPTVARVVWPALAQSAGFVQLQHVFLGILVAIVVGATVVEMGRRVEYAENANSSHVVKRAEPAKVYRSQTIVACVGGLGVLLPLMIYAAKMGRFAAFGGWFIAPLILIGPGILLREMVCGHPGKTSSDSDKETEDRS